MRQLRILLFVFMLSVTTVNILRAQFLTDYTITNFNSKNGLPQNSVIDLSINSAGYLWLTTESGLVRYDGSKFKVFNKSNNQSIVTDHFKWISNTLNGKLIASDKRGNLFLITNHTFKKMVRADTLPYINLRGGLNNEVDVFNLISNRYKKERLYDYFGSIPIDSEHFIVPFRNRLIHFRKTNETGTPIQLPGKIVSLFNIDSYSYLMNTEGNVFRIEKGKQSLSQVKFDMDKNRLMEAIQTEKQLIYWKVNSHATFLKSNNQLFRLTTSDNGSRIHVSGFFNSLPLSTNINQVFYDSVHHLLLIGTDTRGLFFVRSNSLKTLVCNSCEEGTNNAYYAITQVSDTTIVSNYGRMFGKNGYRGNLPALKNFNSECLLTDRHNNIWFGRSDSVFRYSIQTGKTFFIAKCRLSLFAFYEEGDSIWVGHKKGIDYIKNDRLIEYASFDRVLLDAKPESILRGPDKQLWIATCDGVFSLNTFIPKPVPILRYAGICVRHLFYKNEILLMGTYGEGIYALYKNSFVKIPVHPSGNMNIVHSMIDDANGVLWISTNNGLYQTRFESILDFLNGKSTHVYYTFYGDHYGSNLIEFNGGCNPSSLLINPTSLFFPGLDGITYLNPLQSQSMLPQEDIYFDVVKANNQEIPLGDTVYLMPGVDLLRVLYSTPYWYHHDNISAEYKIDGLLENWQPFEFGSKQLTLSSLSPGHFVLRIRKLADYRLNKYIEGQLHIIIPKAYYQTWWFYLLCLLAIVLMIHLIVRFFTFRLQKSNQMLEQKVTERTAELKYANNELLKNINQLTESEQGLQQSVNVKNKLISIISHDIVTPLKFISMVARNAGNANKTGGLNNPSEILKDISNTSEKLYDNARNILNWMRYQNNLISVQRTNVALYPLIEELTEMMAEMAQAQGNIFMNEVSFDDVIHTDKNILSVVLHNIISNANKYCKHAIIRIEGKVTSDGYQISIADNGTGIPPQAMQRIEQIKKKIIPSPDMSTGEGNSLGYIIITDLLELLGGHFYIESSEKGTTVTVVLK